MRDFAERVAVVTGGASGIGAALCRALGRRGARVVVADRDAGGAREVAAAIRIVGGRAIHACLDVRSADAVDALARATASFEGRIDLWVNNAGVAIGGAAESLSLDDWRRVLDVNLAGVIHGVHAVYPRMVKQRAGHIVNVASVAGLAPYPLALPYTTSKHAVVGLSRALRAEARRHGVAVSVACPGAIRTPIWRTSPVRGVLANGHAALLAKLPAWTTAEDCAEAILRGIAANRSVIPITAEAHAAWWLGRLAPALAETISRRLVELAHRLATRPTKSPEGVTARDYRR